MLRIQAMPFAFALSLAISAALSTHAQAEDIILKPAPYDYEYLTVHPEEAKLTDANQLTLKKIFDAIYAQDWKRMRHLYAEDGHYVQHSSYMKDRFDGVLHLFQNLDFESLIYEQTMQMAEGPYVIAVSKLRFNPEAPLMVAVDLNFIRDGKSHSHWDILSPANKNASGRTAFESVITDKVAVSDKERNQNKETIATMINEIFNLKRVDQASKYFSETYYEHGKGSDGIESIQDRVKEWNDAAWDIKRIIADNDLVLAHSRVVIKGEPFARADIYRVRDGKIVEHWESMQLVEQQPKNPNGEF